MSDLANCCEYLTVDKLCEAVSKNQKAVSNRQSRCVNDERMACCYLCGSRRECAISCKYLGSIENVSSPTQAPATNTEAECNPSRDNPTPEQAKVNPVFCPVCNAEMAETQTNLSINGWKSANQSAPADVLPVAVYLCSKCGKIELKANTQT